MLLCGPGHNGADALVAGRQLLGGPWSLDCLLPLGPPSPGSLGTAALRTWCALGQTAATDPGALEAALQAPALLVDGLFGLGLNRPLTGPARACIERVSASGLPVLAVDLPSGLDATSGGIQGVALPATWTLTFVGPKTGFSRGAGPTLCGRIHVADLGVRPEIAQAWLTRRRAAPTGGS